MHECGWEWGPCGCRPVGMCVRAMCGRAGGGGYVSVGGGSTVEVIERTELRIPFVLSHKESAGKV